MCSKEKLERFVCVRMTLIFFFFFFFFFFFLGGGGEGRKGGGEEERVKSAIKEKRIDVKELTLK